MKIACLVLSILGALAALALGIVWLGDASDARELIAAASSMGVDTGEIDSLVRAAYLLIAGGVGAVVAGVLTMKDKGKIGGAILALAVLAPAVFAPKTLIATFLLALAALFAFLAKPRSVVAAA